MKAGTSIELAIITALREEAMAIGAAVELLPAEQRALVQIIQGGVGLQVAAKVANESCQWPNLKLLCNSGFSGGLIEGQSIGSIILAENNYNNLKQDVFHTAMAKLNTEATAVLNAAGIPAQIGKLLSVQEPVFKAVDKRLLGKSSGAAAVDMESAAVARVALQHKKAFFALRVISDTVDVDLPAEVGEFLSEQGKVRPGKIIRFALGGPRNIAELWKLKGHSAQAASALREAWKVVLPVLLAETHNLSLG